MFEDFLFYALPVIAILGLPLKWLFRQNKYKLPPGPLGVPILGYLPFLSSEPYKDFYALSEKYGKVFSLYLGRSLVVVLNDLQSVKEAYGQSTVLDRPPKIFDFVPDGVGFAGTNGAEWIEQRRYTMRTLRDIGLGKSNWVDLVEAEVNEFMNFIQSKVEQPVDIAKPLSASVSNNMTSLIFGKRLPAGDPIRELVDSGVNAVSQAFEQAGVISYFPDLMDFIAKLGVTKFSEFRKRMVAFNEYLRNEIGKRKKTLAAEDNDIYIDNYLKNVEKYKNDENTTFTERNLLGNSQAMLTAGGDTIKASVLWLLLLMVAEPEVQKKVQEEIDKVLGKESGINSLERSKLPYTYATILEGQRWQTIAPNSVLHSASADTKVGGFDIPKGTTVLMNIWALHNDPVYWKDPEKFMPERFLREDGKLLEPKPESFLPFSYGRRICPGEYIALLETFMYFTAFMQRFSVKSAGDELNFKGVLGVNYQPLPHKLIFTTRN